MSPDTVPAFVVTADTAEHPNQELGIFFRALDADRFIETLAPRAWTNVRIMPRAVSADDVHPAHQNVFPKFFQQPTE
jgi:hypothetical protein